MRAPFARVQVVVLALIVVLIVLGGLLSVAPSRAQMMMENPARNAIQQTIQSTRDRTQSSAAPASNKTENARKPVQSAKRESGEDKKAKADPRPSGRNANAPAAGVQDYVPNEIVVEVAASLSPQQITALTQRFRLATVDSFSFQLGGSTVLRLRIIGGRPVPTVVRTLQSDPNVLFVQPNYLYSLVEEKPAADAADEAGQYLARMHLRDAHRLARGDKILVALIDSGVDVAHPDLAGDIADTFDAIGVGAAIHPHGTAVAGGIAAHGKLTGAAPAAQILAVRAFSGEAHSKDGATYAIMKGLDWAVLHGARVVNMSFAGPQDPGVTRGIAAAHARGVVLIAAAGNKGASSPPLFPAADPNVIAVTSTDDNDQLPAFANRGAYVAVAAPGVGLTLLAPNNSQARMSGTSFSAAFVTGTVALMIERKPALGPDEVRRALMASAHHLSDKVVDDQSGGGLVDAYQAILTVAPEVSSETSAAPDKRP